MDEPSKTIKEWSSAWVQRNPRWLLSVFFNGALINANGEGYVTE